MVWSAQRITTVAKDADTDSAVPQVTITLSWSPYVAMHSSMLITQPAREVGSRNESPRPRYGLPESPLVVLLLCALTQTTDYDDLGLHHVDSCQSFISQAIRAF